MLDYLEDFREMLWAEAFERVYNNLIGNDPLDPVLQIPVNLKKQHEKITEKYRLKKRSRLRLLNI